MIHETLRYVNQQILTAIGDAGRSETRGLIVEHYSISFSGFVPSPLNSRLIGAIKAWPCVGRSPNDGLVHRYFVGIIRGRGWGEYQPGDFFDIRPPENRRSIVMADLEDPQTVDAIVTEIRVGIDVVVGFVRAALAGRDVPQASPVALLPYDSRTGEVLEEEGFGPEFVSNVFHADRREPTRQTLTVPVR